MTFEGVVMVVVSDNNQNMHAQRCSRSLTPVDSVLRLEWGGVELHVGVFKPLKCSDRLRTFVCEFKNF